MANDVFELTIEGPGRNALGTDVMRRLLAGLREAGGRPLLLRGAGDTFSAGLDLKEVAGLDAPGMERYLLLLDDLIDALYGYAGPTVAAVNGHAIAGGCVLALCCDLRVMADDARAAHRPERGSARPRVPAEDPRARAPARVPRRWLERVVLEAGLHAPETAHELGLVDELAADCLARRARSARDARGPCAARLRRHQARAPRAARSS